MNFYECVFICIHICQCRSFKAVFMYTSKSILLKTGIIFSVFIESDEQLQVIECSVAVWLVISEDHLLSRHQGCYFLLTALNRPIETIFIQIRWGKSNKIQLCLLCLRRCRGEGNLWFSFKYEISYSGSGLSIITLAPKFSIILLRLLRNLVWPAGGRMALFENH